MAIFSNVPVKFKVLALINFILGLVLLQQSVVLISNSFKEAPVVIGFTTLCFIAAIVASHKDYLNNQIKKIISFLPLVIIVFYFAYLLIISYR
jgi:hypothetical protein